MAFFCLSAGVVAITFLMKSEKSKQTSLVAVNALTLQGEQIQSRVMQADTQSDAFECGNTTTADCCDKSCRTISFELLHNWEVTYKYTQFIGNECLHVNVRLPKVAFSLYSQCLKINPSCGGASKVKNS